MIDSGLDRIRLTKIDIGLIVVDGVLIEAESGLGWRRKKTYFAIVLAKSEVAVA